MSLSAIAASLPQGVHDIIHHKSKWDTGLKQISTENLTDSIEKILKKADSKKAPKAYAFAAKAIQELSVRKLAASEKKTLKSLKGKIKKKINGCVLEGAYLPEAAGIEPSTVKAEKSQPIHHPYANKVIKKHYTKWEKSKTGKDFESYLKARADDTEKKAIKKDSVNYLSTEKAADYEATFDKDGKILKNNQVVDDGSYIFVLNLEGTKLYIGKKEKGSFQHSSFLSGQPVQCAGIFDVKNGKIVAATLHSGHYKPDSKAGKRLREFLTDNKNLGKKAAKKLPISLRTDKKK